jgi:hypothetical protein
MENKEITFSQAIEQVMLNNWYYAPLKLIYREFSKYRKKTWKTPDFTIQERVQRDKKFTKIWYWVYALTDYLDKLPKEKDVKTEKDVLERMHSRIQWMLIEIWNMNWYDTYTPDKKWIFWNKEIWKIATIDKIPPFTYEKIINDSIRFVDVIWFNNRGFPSKLIEVENSTDFRAWFIKMNEIQDLRTDFLFIADEKKKNKFDTERTKLAFKNIKDRCVFQTYDFVEKWYKNQIDWKNFKNH